MDIIPLGIEAFLICWEHNTSLKFIPNSNVCGVNFIMKIPNRIW